MGACRAGGGPPARPPAPSSSAPSALPAVTSTPLDDAPILALWRRAGQDASVLAWDPGAPDARPRIIERVPGLLRGLRDDADVLLAESPGGRLVALSALAPDTNGDDLETIRVAELDGTVVWSKRLSGDVLVAPAWNPTREEFIVPGPGAWLTVAFGPGGARSVASVPVPTFQREWNAGGPHPLVPRIAGFSADGRRVFGAAIDSPFGLGIEPLLA